MCHYSGGNEKKYVLEALDTGWISSEGPFIKKFEEGMAKFVTESSGVVLLMVPWHWI